MTKNDAEPFWARLDVALGVDEGGAPGWSIVISDITEHKRVEQALRESEERFRRIFEEGPLGLALVGRDYRFVKVNSALCKMVGCSEEVLLQMSFTDITHPDDLGDDVELAKRLFRREIPSYRMQKRYMKKNGETIWINLTASIILDHDGEPLYGLAMIENITEVKRTQEEALARQKLESLGTLAGGIAHDFNNLLGGVLTQSELALTELDAGSSCEEELKAIREAAIRGSEIVRQLMIYAGKESEAIGWVDLSKIVEQMLALLKVSVSKHAVMRADLAPELPAIRANPAQLRQIVMNLITNASDAVGDRDGVIRVITRRATLRGESAVSESLPAGDYLTLEVSDTGSGMSPETQRRVFDPFFTTKSAGHGLGLAVVSGIVRSLGGEIRLTSEPGKGSTFRVLLPCAETTGTPTNCPMSGNEESAGPLPDAVVLVVEDEDPLRRAVAKMLRQRGFEVLEAADGSVAINLLRANRGKIDVILLDMTIPGASSREVVAEGANVRADIRVVLTSAYSEEMLTPLMSASQIRGFIRKPFQFVDLAQTLRNALST
jgi:PAS domain S-box-containing protein